MTRIALIRLELREVEGALPRPAGHANARWRARRGLLVRVIDERGAAGTGEASPLPGRSIDDVDGCRRALLAVARHPLPALALGAPLRRQIEALLDDLPADAPAARFGLETALLDLAGRRLGRPIAALLAAAPAASLPLCALVDEEPAEVPAAAARAAAAGAAAIKIKVGRPGRFAEELAAAAAVRAAWPAVSLRLDANGAWSAAEARARLDELAPLRLELVEQPVAAAELAALGPAPLPVAADESLVGADPPAALAALLAARACQAVVLKPAALGGLYRCADLAAAAAGAGVAPVISHLLDGPIALAAAAELALALRPSLPSGLWPHAGLAAWPAATAPPQIQDGRLVAGTHGGHGVEVAP